jgi:hypothetical protein
MKMFGWIYIRDRCAVQTIKIMEAPSDNDPPRGEKPRVL